MNNNNLMSDQSNIPDLIEIKNALNLIERHNNSPHELDKTFIINNFSVDTQFSRNKNIKLYKSELKNEPLFFGEHNYNSPTSFFLELVFLIWIGIAGLILSLILVAIVNFVFGLSKAISYMIFGILATIILLFLILTMIDGMSRAGNQRKLIKSFKGELEEIYENNEWLVLKKYYYKIEDWFKIEQSRYSNLMSAFQKYKDNDAEALPKTNIFINKNDIEDTENMKLSFQKNIDCSLKLWIILSHALAYIKKQMGTYEAKRAILNIENSRDKYLNLEKIQTSIQDLKEHQDYLRVLGQQEILFNPEDVEEIQYQIDQFEKFLV